MPVAEALALTAEPLGFVIPAEATTSMALDDPLAEGFYDEPSSQLHDPKHDQTCSRAGGQSSSFFTRPMVCSVSGWTALTSVASSEQFPWYCEYAAIWIV